MQCAPMRASKERLQKVIDEAATTHAPALSLPGADALTVVTLAVVVLTLAVVLIVGIDAHAFMAHGHENAV